MNIPGSSKCVKFVPFHSKNLPKGRNFTYMEDLGIHEHIPVPVDPMSVVSMNLHVKLQ